MRVQLLMATSWLLPLSAAAAQIEPTPVTRRQILQTALDRAPRLAVARADTAVAFSQIVAARALPNPTVTAEYTKSVPRYHALAELPVDYTWLRRVRVQSAQAARTAAQYRYQFERASIALDADTTYTRALVAIELAQLSGRTAVGADSLRRIAIARRDAGDASDLDVELATVNAGQQANVAAADSLAVVSTLLDLQTVVGMPADHVMLMPVDSLALPPVDSLTLDGAPLPVAAAAAQLEAAQLAARLQRRSVWSAASITFGFETGDPSGDEPGILPAFGIALPLPLLDRNRGAIAVAEAERARAAAELDLARLETQLQATRAARERANAFSRAARDRQLLSSANRVAAMSLTAYREGAASLANVIEAQRSAREVLAQYAQDLAAAWIATATSRLYTLAPTSSVPR